MPKTKSVLVGLASLTLLDIASAAAQPPAPSYNWAGLYIGAHVGGVWADAKVTTPASTYFEDLFSIPEMTQSYSGSGVLAGGHMGYNVMLSPTILAGIEGDWTWTGLRNSRTSVYSGIDVVEDGFTLTRNSEVRLNWQSTFRGRLGVVNGPWLVYGTAGVAFANVKYSETGVLFSETINVLSMGTDGTFPFSSSATKTLVGVVAGIGSEYMLSANWIARIEYLYESFGNATVPVNGATLTNGTLALDDVHKVRVGITYKFGP